MGVRGRGALSQGVCLVGQVAWRNRGAPPQPSLHLSHPTPTLSLLRPAPIPTHPSQVSLGVAMATDAGFGIDPF